MWAIDVTIAAGGIIAIAALIVLWRFTPNSAGELPIGAWHYVFALAQPTPIGEPTPVPTDAYWDLPLPCAQDEGRKEVSFPDSEIVFVTRGRLQDEVIVDLVLDRRDPGGSVGEPASLTLAGADAREASRSFSRLSRWSDGRSVAVTIAISDSGPTVDLDTGPRRERMRLIAGCFTSRSFGGGADGSDPISS